MKLPVLVKVKPVPTRGYSLHTLWLADIEGHFSVLINHTAVISN